MTEDTAMLAALNHIQLKIQKLRNEQHSTTDVNKKISLSRHIKMYKILREQLFKQV